MLVRWPIIIPVGHLSCPFDEFSSWHADSQIHHRAYRPNGCNIYMNLYVYVRMCIIMHPRMCTCICKCMFGYVRICTCIYSYVRSYIHACVYVPMHAYMHACVSVFRLGMRMLCILAVFAFDRPACVGVVRELSNSMRAKPPAGRSIRMLEWCCFITYFAAVLIAVLVFQSTMCVKFCPQRYRVNRL